MGTLSCLILNLLLANPVSPGVFGQVFQSNKASVLLVKTPGTKDLFTTGFIVGARGELVFGLPHAEETREIHLINHIERNLSPEEEVEEIKIRPYIL